MGIPDYSNVLENISVTTIYLMVKTHQKTGLKYLCKTIQDIRYYRGSGVDWKTHLEIHGSKHSTEVIKECHSKEELSYWGRYYSKLWNIVDAMDDFGNKIWANRIPETGGGNGNKGYVFTESHRLNLAEAQQRSTKTPFKNQWGVNNHMYGKRGKDSIHFGIPKTESHKKNISLSHHDVAGNLNPNSKSITIITPDNKTINCFGDFAKQCEILNISLSTGNSLLKSGKIATKGIAKGYRIVYGSGNT